MKANKPHKLPKHIEKLRDQIHLKKTQDLNRIIAQNIPFWQRWLMVKFPNGFFKKLFGYHFRESIDSYRVELFKRGKLLAKNF